MQLERVVQLNLILFFYIAGQATGQADSQQQSGETCQALDVLAAAGTSSSVLGDCVRNSPCTTITCNFGATKTSLTVLPCIDPVAVHFMTDIGTGVDSVISQSAVFDVGSNNVIRVALTQIEDGIQLEMTQAVLPSLTRVLLPDTAIPIQCNFDVIEARASNMNGRPVFTCRAGGPPSLQLLEWETALKENVTGEISVNMTRRLGDAEVTSTLVFDDFAACQDAGGIACVFGVENSSDTVRSPTLECEGDDGSTQVEVTPEATATNLTASGPQTLTLIITVTASVLVVLPLSIVVTILIVLWLKRRAKKIYSQTSLHDYELINIIYSPRLPQVINFPIVTLNHDPGEMEYDDVMLPPNTDAQETVDVTTTHNIAYEHIVADYDEHILADDNDSSDTNNSIAYEYGHESGTDIIQEPISTMGNIAYEDRQNSTEDLSQEPISMVGNIAYEDRRNSTVDVSQEPISMVGNIAYEDRQNSTEDPSQEPISMVGNIAYEDRRNLTEDSSQESISMVGNIAYEDRRNLTEDSSQESISMVGNIAYEDRRNSTVDVSQEPISMVGNEERQDSTVSQTIDVSQELISVVGNTAYENRRGSTEEFEYIGNEPISMVGNVAYEGRQESIEGISQEPTSMVGNIAYEDQPRTLVNI